MKGLTLALALLLAPIARADEFVVNVDANAKVVATATRLGWYQAATTDAQGNVVPAQIIAQGRLAAGGNYHFNLVGTVYQPAGTTQTDQFGNPQPIMAALPGIWFRIRYNGDVTKMPAVANAAGVTVYRWQPSLNAGAGCWSSDGAACAPDYVGSIGLML